MSMGLCPTRASRAREPRYNSSTVKVYWFKNNKFIPVRGQRKWPEYVNGEALQWCIVHILLL